jgi:hypothetical protein
MCRASAKVYFVNHSRPLLAPTPSLCNIERTEDVGRPITRAASSTGRETIRSKSRCCSGFVHAR